MTPKKADCGKIIFFYCKLETSMGQYHCQMQKLKNEVKGRRDVQMDKQKIHEKEEGREGLKKGRREREG